MDNSDNILTFALVKLIIVTFNAAKVMKNNEKTNISSKNCSKLTLKDYYSALPEASCPKTEFMNEVAKKCGVSLSTVRNWIRFGMKPSNPKHVEILSQLTGIDAEDLWKD